MSLENLEKAFQLIENNFTEEEKSRCQSFSLETIKRAESFLNIKFPASYREFLKKYGYGDFGGLEIYGLTKEEKFNIESKPIIPRPNIVWMTVQYNLDFKHPLYLLIIYELGEGTKYCLDLSQMKGDECPVVVWPIFGYENNPKLEIIAQDFGDFLLEMVEDEIRYRQEEDEEA